MFGLPAGMIVESLVTVLLAVTIGYCVVLNQRLKRLHNDRDQLRRIVTDLVQATNLANSAIQELKAAASDAETGLQHRINEAEQLGVELANHVTSGMQVMDKLAKISSLVRQNQPMEERLDEPNKARSALEQLSLRPRIRGSAA
jgi:hypothetical protein